MKQYTNQHLIHWQAKIKFLTQTEFFKANWHYGLVEGLGIHWCCHNLFDQGTLFNYIYIFLKWAWKEKCFALWGLLTLSIKYWFSRKTDKTHEYIFLKETIICKINLSNVLGNNKEE